MCVTTADITDRNGAIDMLKKYNDNVSQVQIFLQMLGNQERNLLIQYLKFQDVLWMWVKRNKMHVLRLFLKDRLWKGHFLAR